jgi:hypothetical protein
MLSHEALSVRDRNESIMLDLGQMTVSWNGPDAREQVIPALAVKYGLSEKAIKRIIRATRAEASVSNPQLALLQG